MGANRIDVHHHYIPPEYGKLLRDKGIQPGGIPLPNWSEGASHRIMAVNGIKTAVVSVSTPGVWFGDSTESRYWAQHVNEYGAQLVSDHGERFGFFASISLPDVDAAVEQVRYAYDTLHADGIVLLANNEGIYPGDPRFEKLLDVLNEYEAVVFVHPGELPAEPVPNVPTFAADFLLDTTRAAISLIMSGAMEKYDKIKFILAHAGGFLPYSAYRIVLARLRDQSKLELARKLVNRDKAIAEEMKVFRRFWYDTALSSSPTVFPALLEAAGPDRILFGSDFPFNPGVGVTFMTDSYRKQDKSVITDPIRAKIDRENAVELFPRLR